METETKERKSSAHASADLDRGRIEAGVEVAAPPERVFQSLASGEIVEWWVRPGVFDTREWAGEVRTEGGWRAAGVGQSGPYVLEGEFLEVDPPRQLTHTWRAAGAPESTAVTYVLEPSGLGTRIRLEHSGFTSPQVCAATSAGWEASFQRLEELLAGQPPPQRR
jgi:uncharacterized protein YndB with AHSA1/START domain